MLSLETKANGNPLQRPPPGAQGATGAPGAPGTGGLQMRSVAALGNGVQLGGQNQQQQQLQQRQQQQQLLTQSLQGNGAGGIQTPATGLTSNLSAMTGVPQNPMAAMAGQVMNPTMMNNRLQQMQQQQRQAVQQQQVSQQQQQVCTFYCCFSSSRVLVGVMGMIFQIENLNCG